MTTRQLRLFLACLGSLAIVCGSNSWGCPFCDTPSTTFSEQLETSHVTVLAKWVSAVKPDPNDFAEGTTTYQVIESAGKSRADFPAGKQFVIERYIPDEPGEESVFFAAFNDDKLVWGLPSRVSRDCWKYIVHTPPRSLPHSERLPYFLAVLEHEDPDIAMDAYGEFGRVDYSDLKAVSPLLPRQKVLSWLQNPETVPTRKGLYGLMIGLCGNADDARILREIVREQPEDSRMGIDGMMAGYMLLTGDAGLKELRLWKLDNPATPEGEIYAFMKALEFMWSYGRDRVDAHQLRLSMRKLLERPQFTSLAIVDLARWQDWEIMDQLVKGYGKEPFADRDPRQRIIRFLIAAEKDAGIIQTAGESIDYSSKAKEHLSALRETDPTTVKYVERYPFD